MKTKLSKLELAKLLESTEQYIYDTITSYIDEDEVPDDQFYAEIDRVRAEIGKALVIPG